LTSMWGREPRRDLRHPAVSTFTTPPGTSGRWPALGQSGDPAGQRVRSDAAHQGGTAHDGPRRDDRKGRTRATGPPGAREGDDPVRLRAARQVEVRAGHRVGEPRTWAILSAQGPAYNYPPVGWRASRTASAFDKGRLPSARADSADETCGQAALHQSATRYQATGPGCKRLAAGQPGNALRAPAEHRRFGESPCGEAEGPGGWRRKANAVSSHVGTFRYPNAERRRRYIRLYVLRTAKPG